MPDLASLDYDAIQDILPLVLSILLPWLAFVLLGPRSPIARVVVAGSSMLIVVRYLWWRWAYSIPDDQDWWQAALTWTFLIIESAATFGTLLSFFFMSRYRDRSPEVDARPNAATLAAPVDVFIATYNEDAEILERTIVCALHIDHPDLRVWVCDDGARPWLREMAERLGAHYVFRVKGKHAKAGNMNNALQVAMATDRPPEFVLLLDADFVASRMILKRTLPLMEEPDVGIVQTPQHYYNHDPVQSNLFCFKSWPDEQRFFFNHFLPCKDAWDAAFCCGTSAIFRVSALVSSGGFATATVTEDMLTTFMLREHGYRTVYLNERLALGLAPEGLDEFIIQRQRWCLGTLQQIRTRWCFFGSARVGLINRLSYFDGALFWAAGYISKLCFITGPLLTWWLHTSVITCTNEDFVVMVAPKLASGLVFGALLGGNTIFPILSEATHLPATPAIIASAAVALVRPWGRPFKVTPKGISSDRFVVRWNLLAPYATIAVLTFLGMVANLSLTSAAAADRSYAVNILWSLVNIATLAVVCASCVEAPKRKETRFSTAERATLQLGVGAPQACVITELSIETASFTFTPGTLDLGSAGELLLDHGSLGVPCTVLRASASGEAVLLFQHNETTRHALIRKLMTGAYHNDVEEVRVFRSLSAATRRVFG
jgi:cellulose synthase (UDP-forming)